MKVLREKRVKKFRNKIDEDSIGDYIEYKGIIQINKKEIPYIRKLTITSIDDYDAVYFTDYIELESKYEKYFDDIDLFLNS